MTVPETAVLPLHHTPLALPRLAQRDNPYPNFCCCQMQGPNVQNITREPTLRDPDVRYRGQQALKSGTSCANTIIDDVVADHERGFRI